MEAALGGRELLLLLPLAAALLGLAAPLQLGQVLTGPVSGTGAAGARWGHSMALSPCVRGVSRALLRPWASAGRRCRGAAATVLAAGCRSRPGGIAGGSRWRGWRRRARPVAREGGVPAVRGVFRQRCLAA